MSKTARSLAGIALLAATASADLVLGTFDTPAADSVAVTKAYGAKAFSNTASERGLAVGADGALTLTVTLAADAGKDYSAKAGILVPLNNLWAPMDIRTATAVSFRIKGSGAYNVNFALGSDVYPNADDGVVMVAPVKVTTSWAEKSIALQPTPALAWLSWMEDEERFPGGTAASIIMDPTDPDYADETVNVAMAVKQVQFNIDPTWTNDSVWSAPGAGLTSLSVDDIVVVGIGGERYPLVLGQNCGEGIPSVVLSSHRFQANEEGLPWKAYTDSSGIGLVGGWSRLVTPAPGQIGIVDTSAKRIRMIADLSRPGSRPEAGFAGVAFRTPWDFFLDFTGAVAMGFSLSIPPGSSIDSNLVVGVLFKLLTGREMDPAPYQALIPATQFRAGQVSVCVDLLKDLRASSDPWNAGASMHPLTSDLSYVTGFAWELRMLGASIYDTIAPRQGFELGPVVLHGRKDLPGLTCIWGGSWPGSLCTDAVRTRVRSRSFGVLPEGDGWVEIAGLEGYRRVDIFSLAGARVASFEPDPISRLRLERGTYLVVAKGEGLPSLSRTLLVAR